MVTSTVRIDWGARSHVGMVRTVNEDSFAASPDACIWAVADGMGGHAQGERASQAVAACIEAVPPQEDMQSAVDAVADAIHRANADIFAEASGLGVQMGTTIVALAIKDWQFAVLWVGDSRAYLLRNGQLVQLTQDHTQVQMMVGRGLIDAADAESHPMSHVLSRAVGVQEALELDVIVEDIRPGDVLLLCSDGVHNLLRDAEIVARIQYGNLEEGLEEIIRLCLERGAPDNATTIAVRVEEPTLLVFGPPAA